jgi:hypothetical protein
MPGVGEARGDRGIRPRAIPRPQRWTASLVRSALNRDALRPQVPTDGPRVKMVVS